VIEARWREVEELKRRQDQEHLRSLSVTEAFQQFTQLMELAEKIPKRGNLRRLRQQKIEQLVAWRRKMDTLGRKECP